MKIDLAGKTAIVTGSTSGIGFAIARGLAAAGATVVINGRSKAALDKAIEELEPYTVRSVAADLGTAEGCAKLLAAEPSCDILVNNLGVYGQQDFVDIEDDEWTRFFEINVMSGVRLSRAYRPAMLDRNWGRILFTSSESAINIPTDMIHYGFTKTAILALSRGLAKRAAGTGVTVNAILPGPTLSEGLEEMLGQEAEKSGKSIEAVATAFVKKERPSSIIERAASVEEVANLFVYIASSQASATTGAALRVDGGVVESIV